MIHLEHHAGPIVATKAIAIMQAGGVWLIWCAGDEGFLMAPSDSARAVTVRKHWASEIVGEYTANVDQDDLVAAMKETRLQQLRIERKMGCCYLSHDASMAKNKRRREKRMAQRIAA